MNERIGTKWTATFDSRSIEWNRNKGYNRIFIRAQEHYWNDMLNARGHVFLNEIYDGLGLPRIAAGQLVGWIADGQFHIEFKQEEIEDSVILLYFDTHGVIYDKIGA